MARSTAKGSIHRVKAPPACSAEAAQPPAAFGRRLMCRRGRMNTPISLQQPPSGRPSLGSQTLAAAAAFSCVTNALAACLSTGRARPVVQQPLLDQQVDLRRLAAAAAGSLADAASIEWCVKTTRPAAPEGWGSSSPGREPKQRPPGRAGRGRGRRERMSPWTKTFDTPKKRSPVRAAGSRRRRYGSHAPEWQSR